MKKTKNILCTCVIAITLSSCATVFGGHITECQKQKPATGHRELRPVALICDVFITPIPIIALAVDFADGAIYKPCNGSAK